MSQRTKKRIHNVFVQLLNQESLDKITVKDLVDQCQINRNTFYYYYRDLYALLDEILQEELTQIMGRRRTFSSWQEGVLDALQFTLDNRRAVYHVFNSGAREHVVRYLLQVGEYVLEDFVRTAACGLTIDPADEKLLVDLYKHAIVGVLSDWLLGGMKEDPESYIRRAGVILDGNIRRALENSAASPR